MIKEIEADKIESKGLSQVPSFTDNAGLGAFKTRTFGNKDIRTDYIQLKRFIDITVTVPPLDGGTGDTGYVRTTETHGITDAVPFVFLYIKSGANYIEVPANYGLQVIGNIHYDNAQFYFDIDNSDVVAQTIEFRAYIYELRKKL